jgi:beta-lactam-binding protein with PASTA domain
VQIIGKVITQTPLSGTEAAAETKVAITIGKGMDSQAAKVT